MEYRFKWNRSWDMWQPVRRSHRKMSVTPAIGDTLVLGEGRTRVEYICVPSNTEGCDRSCKLHPERSSGHCCRHINGIVCRTWRKFIDKTQVEDLI
jgi:hypothetical protein